MLGCNHVFRAEALLDPEQPPELFQPTSAAETHLPTSPSQVVLEQQSRQQMFFMAAKGALAKATWAMSQQGCLLGLLGYRSGIVLLPHFLAENGILVGSLVLSSITSSAKFTLKLKATSTRTMRGDARAASLF